MGEKKVKIEVTPEVTRQIATRRVMGASFRDLESEFGFSRPVINRVLSSDMGKKIMKGLVDDAVASAVIAVRQEMSNLTPLVSEAIAHHLKEKSLEAVKIVLKGLGMESFEKPENQQSQTFQVILPGTKAPKDVPSDIEV